MIKYLFVLISLSLPLTALATPSEGECSRFINLNVHNIPMPALYFGKHINEIDQCMASCGSLYGGNDQQAVLNNVSYCKSHLATLSFIGHYRIARITGKSSFGHSNNPPAPGGAAAASDPKSAFEENTGIHTNNDIRWF